jgi:2-phospho-L-lactate/phosphoenolpyruvate guanylyltransferase
LSGVFAIVPVREFKNTKLRLSGVLSEAQRAALTQALLVHVCEALEASKIAGVFVVSSCADETSKVLQRFAKVRVIQESNVRGGVNSAVWDGVSKIAKVAGDPKILVIPTDLPLVSSKIVDQAIDLIENHDIVINPSLKKDGTNLLGFRLSKMIPLSYDRNSYTNHLNEVKARKLDYTLVEWDEFLYDIDDPSDLESIQKMLKVASFDSLISALQGTNE